jgi:hypothetical protein
MTLKTASKRCVKKVQDSSFHVQRSGRNSPDVLRTSEDRFKGWRVHGIHGNILT